MRSTKAGDRFVQWTVRHLGDEAGTYKGSRILAECLPPVAIDQKRDDGVDEPPFFIRDQQVLSRGHFEPLGSAARCDDGDATGEGV